jgi:hypothetical protein
MSPSTTNRKERDSQFASLFSGGTYDQSRTVDGDEKDGSTEGWNRTRQRKKKEDARSFEGFFDGLFSLAVRLAVRGGIPTSRFSLSLLGKVDFGERVWLLRENLVEAFLERRRRRALRTLYSEVGEVISYTALESGGKKRRAHGFKFGPKVEVAVGGHRGGGGGGGVAVPLPGSGPSFGSDYDGVCVRSSLILVVIASSPLASELTLQGLFGVVVAIVGASPFPGGVFVPEAVESCFCVGSEGAVVVLFLFEGGACFVSLDAGNVLLVVDVPRLVRQEPERHFGQIFALREAIL